MNRSYVNKSIYDAELIGEYQWLRQKGYPDIDPVFIPLLDAMAETVFLPIRYDIGVPGETGGYIEFAVKGDVENYIRRALNWYLNFNSECKLAGRTSQFEYSDFQTHLIEDKEFLYWSTFITWDRVGGEGEETEIIESLIKSLREPRRSS